MVVRHFFPQWSLWIYCIKHGIFFYPNCITAIQNNGLLNSWQNNWDLKHGSEDVSIVEFSRLIVTTSYMLMFLSSIWLAASWRICGWCSLEWSISAKVKTFFVHVLGSNFTDTTWPPSWTLSAGDQVQLNLQDLHSGNTCTEKRHLVHQLRKRRSTELQSLCDVSLLAAAAAALFKNLPPPPKP